MKRTVNDEADGSATGNTPAENPVIDRRRLVIGGSAIAAGLATAPQSRAAGEDPAGLILQPGDRIQMVRGEHVGKLLRPEMLELNGKQTEAFPFDPKAGVVREKNRLNRLLILMLSEAEMDDETKAASAGGVLAYSAICTHRGCTVKSWKKEVKHLRCHCHLSEWKALEKAAIVRGPAKRNLPIVPLGLDADGYVIAKDGFSATPGAAKK